MPPDFNFPFGGVRMWTPVREDPATEARDRDYFLPDSGVRYLGPLIPEDIFRIGEFTLDRTVLMYSVAITLATPFIFGLFPALGISRSSLVGALKAGDSLKVRRARVVAEVAMAIVLIGGTGLMLRSFVELQKVDIGFDGNRVLTVLVTTPESDYPTKADSQNLFDRATAELQAFAAVAGIFAVTAVVASVLPSEAARTNPVVVLRYD